MKETRRWTPEEENQALKQQIALMRQTLRRSELVALQFSDEVERLRHEARRPAPAYAAPPQTLPIPPAKLVLFVLAAAACAGAAHLYPERRATIAVLFGAVVVTQILPSLARERSWN